MYKFNKIYMLKSRKITCEMTLAQELSKSDTLMHPIFFNWAQAWQGFMPQTRNLGRCSILDPQSAASGGLIDKIHMYFNIKVKSSERHLPRPKSLVHPIPRQCPKPLRHLTRVPELGVPKLNPASSSNSLSLPTKQVTRETPGVTTPNM